jgi:hypothetical protein
MEVFCVSGFRRPGAFPVEFPVIEVEELTGSVAFEQEVEVSRLGAPSQAGTSSRRMKK